MRIPRLLLLLALLLLVGAPPVLAQAQVGVRTGLAVSNFYGRDAEGSEARLGFHGGLTLALPVAPNVFLQPEALYTQKGSGFEGEDTVFRLDYIDVPVLVGVSVPTGSNLIARLYAGPQVSFKVNESLRGEGVGVDLGLARDVDFGLAVGGDIGARRVGSAQTFGVGLRYTLGLSNVLDDALLDGAFQPSDLSHRVFTVTAFYTF